MSEVMYQYDGTLDGFLCCVYESYVYKETPAAFCCDEDPLSLFEVRTVITQPAPQGAGGGAAQLPHLFA